MDGKYYVTQSSDDKWDAIVEFDDHGYIKTGFTTIRQAQAEAAMMVARLTHHKIHPATVPAVRATGQKADKTMYKVVQQDDGTWIGHIRVQDGIEYTDRYKNKDDTVSAVIRAARILNGVYVLREEVVVVPHNSPVHLKNGKTGIIAPATLEKILSGELVLVPTDSKILKYRITDEECEQVLARREGRDASSE